LIQFPHVIARLWKPDRPTSPPTYTWRRNRNVSHRGWKNADSRVRTLVIKTSRTDKSSVPAVSGTRCTYRFPSTGIVDRGILLEHACESAPMDNEKELIDTFDRVVHQDFPNPQRVGCPGREALVELAQHPTNTELPKLMLHVRQCAPCFDELKELRQKARIQSP